VSGDTLIGTDGSASSLRMEFLKSGFFNFSQSYQDYGYKELCIPAAAGGGFRFEKNALHIWPRGSYMLIALPNMEGDFTCTLFMSYNKGERNFDKIKTPEGLSDFFREVMPDAMAQMPGLQDDFFNNPTGSLLTVKCFPWNMGGKALLLGDAAHAMVPFFGQGMNCGFEDCYYLDVLIGEHGADWKKIFSEFGLLRKENTDAIADLAVENFVEMRDLVTHKDFILKKKADILLEEHFPDRFISKYAMVSFHRIPYSLAMKRGQIQDRILMEMCGSIDRIEELNTELAFTRIQKEFEKYGIQGNEKQ
jgi:kynurenine 3-monooxygenase